MKPGLLWRFQFWAKRSLIFGSVFCFGALLLRAEVQGEKFEEISEESNLEELLQFAAKNSFELEAAFEEWRAALERVPQARSLPDPELTYGYFVRRMETRQLVSVSQMFPWFGKLKLGGGGAEKEAAAAAAEIDAVKAELFRKVKTVYSELAFLDHAVRTAEENRKLLEQFERIVLARLRTGEGRDADLLRVEMEIESIGEEIEMLEATRLPLWAELNSILGRPADAILPKAKISANFEKIDFSERPVSEWLAENPRLRAVEYDVSSRKLGVDRAKRESKPDVTIGVEGMENRGGRNELMVSASVNVPIWRKRYAAVRKEAAANLRAGEAKREQLIRSLEAEWKLALFRLKDAERKIGLYEEEMLPRARRTVSSLEAAYRTESRDFFHLIDAQERLLEIELKNERAKIDRFQQLAVLEELTAGSWISNSEDEREES